MSVGKMSYNNQPAIIIYGTIIETISIKKKKKMKIISILKLILNSVY